MRQRHLRPQSRAVRKLDHKQTVQCWMQWVMKWISQLKLQWVHLLLLQWQELSKQRHSHQVNPCQVHQDNQRQWRQVNQVEVHQGYQPHLLQDSNLLWLLEPLTPQDPQDPMGKTLLAMSRRRPEQQMWRSNDWISCVRQWNPWSGQWRLERKFLQP